MRRNTKIIQINGIRGMFLALFTVICLAAGFIAFPGFVAAKVWNYFAGFGFVPVINLFQGIMLWAIIAISTFIITDKKKQSFIAFKSPKELSEEELKQVMNAIKMQTKLHAQRPMVIRANDLEKLNLKEITKPVDFAQNKDENPSQDEKKEKENV